MLLKHSSGLHALQVSKNGLFSFSLPHHAAAVMTESAVTVLTWETNQNDWKMFSLDSIQKSVEQYLSKFERYTCNSEMKHFDR